MLAGVCCTVKLKWLALRLQVCPLQSLVQDEVLDAAIILHQPVRERPVPPQLGRLAMEQVNPIDPCQPPSVLVHPLEVALPY